MDDEVAPFTTVGLNPPLIVFMFLCEAIARLKEDTHC